MKFAGRCICLSVLILVGCASTDSTKLCEGKKAFAQERYRCAFETLMPLAAKGNADAEYAVGYMYFYGHGTIEDPDLANNWIRKAAAQGQPDAVRALEVMCVAINKDNQC